MQWTNYVGRVMELNIMAKNSFQANILICVIRFRKLMIGKLHEFPYRICMYNEILIDYGYIKFLVRLFVYLNYTFETIRLECTFRFRVRNVDSLKLQLSYESLNFSFYNLQLFNSQNLLP